MTGAKKSSEWVYERLYCEFDHWDFCLEGLLIDDGQWFVCFATGTHRQDGYLIVPVDMDDECKEYLADYEVAYKHWVYKDGRRSCMYGKWDLSWLAEKWSKNPITDKARPLLEAVK